MGKGTSNVKYVAVITTVDILSLNHQQLTTIGLTFRELQNLWRRKCNQIGNNDLVQSDYNIEYCPDNVGYTDTLTGQDALIHMFYYKNLTK